MGKNINELPAAAALDGTELAEVLQDGVNRKVPVSNLVPYKKYVALLAQTGTDAPVATVLENTLGGTVVWAYVSTGNYTATLASAFTVNKTAVFVSGNGGLMGSNIDSTSQITIYSKNDGGDPEDGYIQTAAIEIRVYP